MLFGRLANQRVERCHAAAQLGNVFRVLRPFGRQARCGAFEHAANLDRVADVLDRELARDESTRRPRLEQAFLSQPVEHQAQRRTRDVQARRQRHFA